MLRQFLRFISSPLLGGISLVPAFVLALCIFALVGFAFQLDLALWQHLLEFLLSRVLLNTLFLLFAVCLMSLLLGLSLAYIVVFVDFPGRRFFDQALAVPIAVPAYVLAFVWIGFLDYSGPLQSFVRSIHGFENFDLSVRNGMGAAIVLSLCLYPYVYFLAREAFLSQGQRLSEAAKSLGLNSRQCFFRVTLPFARPWVYAGLSLVALETLSDFGVAMAFNYETWTVLTYRTWFDHFSLSTAAQLCLIQLASIFVLLSLIQLLRRKGHYTRLSTDKRPQSERQGLSSWILTFTLAGFLFCVLGLPLLQLTLWAWQAGELYDTLSYFQNSLFLGCLAGAIVLVLSLVSTSFQRLFRDLSFIRIGNQFALLGYAFPGTVMAVSFIVGLNFIWGSFSSSVALSFFAMTAALSIRYFSVGFRGFESAYERIPKQFDEAAGSLGRNRFQIFREIHWPLLKPASFSAFFLVFMDVAKEMPIQVMMRPFGWDSLSTKVFQYTSEGQWELASGPALALVTLSLLLGFLFKPSWELSRKIWTELTHKRRDYVLSENKSTLS